MDVIIVGAGIGGLATGLRLAAKGYDVKIYEEAIDTGGRVNRIRDKGFTFDSTASIAMMPNDYIDIFNSVGLDIEEYVKIVKPDYTYRIFDTNNREITLYKDLSEMSKELVLKSDTSIDDFLSFINAGYDKYDISNKYFLNSPMLKFSDFFNAKNLEKIMELNPFISCYDELKKYINDDLILNALSYQSMYVGLSPYESSSVYSMIPAVTQVDGIIYFAGGMYSYVEALTRAFKDMGGKIHLNSKVDKVIVDDGKVTGVAVDGDIKYSDLVILNCDYRYAINNLLDFDKEKYIDIFDYDYTCSVFMLYLGVDTRYNKLLLHNIIIGPDYKDNVTCITEGRLPTNPPVYVYNPTILEDVKSNYQTLNCIVRVPNLKDLNIEWNRDIINTMENRIIKSLCSIPGLERIKEHIVYKQYLTPKDLEEKYNAPFGSAFGISPKLEMTNILRPAIEDDEIDGLYHIGDSTHPGAGISVIIKGSKLVCDRICETRGEIKKDTKRIL